MSYENSDSGKSGEFGLEPDGRFINPAGRGEVVSLQGLHDPEEEVRIWLPSDRALDDAVIMYTTRDGNQDWPSRIWTVEGITEVPQIGFRMLHFLHEASTRLASTIDMDRRRPGYSVDWAPDDDEGDMEEEAEEDAREQSRSTEERMVTNLDHELDRLSTADFEPPEHYRLPTPGQTFVPLTASSSYVSDYMNSPSRNRMISGQILDSPDALESLPQPPTISHSTVRSLDSSRHTSPGSLTTSDSPHLYAVHEALRGLPAGRNRHDRDSAAERRHSGESISSQEPREARGRTTIPDQLRSRVLSRLNSFGRHRPHHSSRDSSPEWGAPEWDPSSWSWTSAAIDYDNTTNNNQEERPRVRYLPPPPHSPTSSQMLVAGSPATAAAAAAAASDIVAVSPLTHGRVETIQDRGQGQVDELDLGQTLFARMRANNSRNGNNDQFGGTGLGLRNSDRRRRGRLRERWMRRML